MGNQNSSQAFDEALESAPPAAWVAGPSEGAPSPRESAAAIITSAAAAERLCIVGGRGEIDKLTGEPVEYDDVHILSGDGTWSSPKPSGRTPRSRSGHTALHLPGLGLLVYGGLSAERGYLSDASLLCEDADGSLKWVPICAGGQLPCARDKHSVALVPSQEEGGTPSMLVFGGFGILPPPEEGEEAGEDVGEDVGEAGEDVGEDKTQDARGPSVDMGWFDDAYLLDPPPPATPLDGMGWRWQRIEAEEVGTAAERCGTRPDARAAHATSWIGGADGAMVLFGGRTQRTRVDDTWLFFPGSQGEVSKGEVSQGEVSNGRGSKGMSKGVWVELSKSLHGPCPSARSFHNLVTLAHTPRRLAALYGGLDAGGQSMGDLHLLDLGSALGPPLCAHQSALQASGALGWARVRVGELAPVARGMAAMAAVSGKLLLFGGSSEWDAQLGGASVFHNDTFCIDLTEAIGTAQRVGDGQAAANAEAQQAPKRGEAPVTIEPAEAQLAPKPAEAVRIVETSLDLADENEDGNGGDAAVAKRIKLQGEPGALPTSV